MAAYALNPKVKKATPALRKATQIGILQYANPERERGREKNAIVVLSFGTTFREEREKTIHAIVRRIEKAHPQVKVVTAFTSHIVIDCIKKKEGILYPTPEQALEQLEQDGYTGITLACLGIIPGIEYDYGATVFHSYKHRFGKMTCGTPLMYWQGQEEQPDDVTEALLAVATQFPKQGPQDAILLMAHGTPQPANAYYSVMQARLEEMGHRNVYIYTVEGWPTLETILHKLKANGIGRVTLMPLMVVAGDHATNDMAGDHPGSHRSLLLSEGFAVDTYIHGIGENEAVQSLYVQRAHDAWNACVMR